MEENCWKLTGFCKGGRGFNAALAPFDYQKEADMNRATKRRLAKEGRVIEEPKNKAKNT